MADRTIELYMDAEEQWRWRVWAPNGRILADSGQGYTNRVDAARMAQSLFPALTFRSP